MDATQRRNLRKEMDDLVIEYGRGSRVFVLRTQKGYHFHASKEHGCETWVSPEIFDRLVREGRIDEKGHVLDG